MIHKKIYDCISHYNSCNIDKKYELLTRSTFIEYYNKNLFDSADCLMIRSSDNVILYLKKSTILDKIDFIPLIMDYLIQVRKNFGFRLLDVDVHSTIINVFINLIENGSRSIWPIVQFMTLDRATELKKLASFMGSKEIFLTCLGFEMWFDEQKLKKESLKTQQWVSSLF
jgi:hypothetical protein